MYFQTGQVIFVPEWPKGEFVSILALFCVWTKSLICKRCWKQGFHFQSDVMVRRNSSSLSAVWTMLHPVRTFFCLLLHSSEQSIFPSRRQTPASSVWTMCLFHPDIPLYREVSCASLFRPDVSAASPDDHQNSFSHWFFPSSKEGKINQPSGRCGIPSGRVSP
jgi:hypothetical protein